ncbi:hypothetical protein ACJJTC_018605 [Scirpophaga incertulas]
MPKRKNKNTDEYILKKLKKLEKKLKKRSRKKSSSSDSEVELQFEESQLEEPTEASTSANIDPIEVTEISSIDQQPTTGDEGKENVEPEVSLDEDILALLGETPTKNKKFSAPIQKELAIRWEHIATNGLQKPVKREMLEKYFIPENCTKIGSPQLNPEIKAALSEALQKKDKAIEQKQSQQAAAISCIGQALTKIFNNKDNKDNEVIKLLIDAGGLLCDSQYVESMSRRSFVTSSIKKEVKDQIYLTEIDNYLFGEKLSETLKTAKAINKSSADIKTVQSKSSNLPQPKRNLNLRPPFPPERQMGTGKKSAHFHRRHQVGVYLPPHPTTSSQIPQRPLQPPQRSRGKPQQRR